MSSAALLPKKQQIQPVIDRESLNNWGKAVNWVTFIMMIARAAFLAFPLVYILGADDWMTSVWFVIYAIVFFGNLIFYLTVFCVAINKGPDRNKIFGKNIVSWNPLRRFYNAFFFNIIDWGTQMALWVTWLTRNPAYMNSPNHNKTPGVNAPGYFPFQMLCGAFIFTSAVYYIFGFQLLRSLWAQKQALTIRADSVNTPSDKSAVGQFSVRGTKDLVNINLRSGASKVSLTQGVVQAYIGFGSIFSAVMVTYLIIVAVQIFHHQIFMRYDALTALLYIALGFFICLIFVYYVGWYRKASVQKLVLESEANNDTVTAETNAELDNEMSSYFLFGFFVFFFNVLFAIYAYSLTGTNAIQWNTLPQFDPLAIIQSPQFLVWLTLAALDMGVLCFFFYYFVVFIFIGNWNIQPEESEPVSEIDVQNTPIERSSANYLSIGLVAFLLAVWIVFYAFVIEAMVGGHFFAEHIFPITIAFALFFAAGIVLAVYVTYRRLADLDAWTYANRMERLWLINRDWHLSMYRTVVAISVTFVLQVVILSVTVHNYFEPQRSSPWECILSTPSTAVPPYSSCNVYWSASILAMFCTLLVYFVCIVNSISTLTIRVQVITQVSRAVRGK